MSVMSIAMKDYEVSLHGALIQPWFQLIYTCLCLSVDKLASFPGRRRNGLATCASSNLTVYGYDVKVIEYFIPTV